MIKINLDKAKNIAHDKRRLARSKEFAQWDTLATVPAYAEVAESERQKIRDKYEKLQNDMNAAENVEDLKALLPENN